MNLFKLFLITFASLAVHHATAQTSAPPANQTVWTGNENFSMKIFGFGQARLTNTNSSNNDDTSTFDIPLARLAFEGGAFLPNVSYMVQFQANTLGNSNGLVLSDGWMQYRHSDYLAFKVGRFLLPYSRQFYTHPGNLLLPDVSIADLAFNLPRSTGAGVSGQVGRLGYNLAAVNSVTPLAASSEHNKSNHLAYIGRLEFDILDPYGYMESVPSGKTGPQLSVGAAASANRMEVASSLQNLKPGDNTTGFTFDGGFRWMNVSLQAAYYTRHAKGAAYSADDKGMYAQAGYYVCSHDEIVVRSSSVSFDQANAGSGALGDVQENSVGINHYFKGHNLKLQADHTWAMTTPFTTGDKFEDKQFRLQTQFLF